jgi:hypothetical protein
MKERPLPKAIASLKYWPFFLVINQIPPSQLVVIFAKAFETRSELRFRLRVGIDPRKLFKCQSLLPCFAAKSLEFAFLFQ